MVDHSDYQKKIIRRFYDNREQVDEQRLAELVTNLYLTEGQKKLDKLWTQAQETMVRLRVPKSRVEHLMKAKDPALIAEVVKEIEAGTLKREAPAKPG
jgi:ATP/maltotriose-dependent transcriptional regulator MalT